MTEQLVKTDSTLTIQEQFDSISSYRQDLMKEKTDPIYIQVKDKFPYLPSKYIDDVFNKWFPIHTIKQVNRSDVDGYIHYTVEITVAFPNGTVMSRLGTGAMRKQLKTAARIKIDGDPKNNILPLVPRYEPTVFDYVDNGNCDKAALTLAIKNCQERFGIGADITERVIYTREQIEEINITLKEGIELIKNPRDKIQAKEKMSKTETPSQKLRLINQLAELFEEFNNYINETKL